jgi:hypothetical protein
VAWTNPPFPFSPAALEVCAHTTVSPNGFAGNEVEGIRSANGNESQCWSTCRWRRPLGADGQARKPANYMSWPRTGRRAAVPTIVEDRELRLSDR